MKYETICLVRFGAETSIFVSEEKLTARQVLAYLRREKGPDVDMCVFDNMRFVETIPPLHLNR